MVLQMDLTADWREFRARLVSRSAGEGLEQSAADSPPSDSSSLESKVRAACAVECVVVICVCLPCLR